MLWNSKQVHPQIWSMEKPGFSPLEILIKIRMVSFWVSLITGSQDKIVFKLYIICTKLQSEGLLKFKWLEKIISIINECGMSYVYLNQAQMDKNFLKNQFLTNIKSALKQQFIQKWDIYIYLYNYNAPNYVHIDILQ